MGDNFLRFFSNDEPDTSHLYNKKNHTRVGHLHEIRGNIKQKTERRRNKGWRSLLNNRHFGWEMQNLVAARLGHGYDHTRTLLEAISRQLQLTREQQSHQRHSDGSVASDPCGQNRVLHPCLDEDRSRRPPTPSGRRRWSMRSRLGRACAKRPWTLLWPSPTPNPRSTRRSQPGRSGEP